MNENLIQPNASMLQENKQKVLVNSFIILALFVVSLLFFFTALDTIEANLVWSILWSISFLIVGLLGLLIYKTKFTKITLIRALQTLFYLLIAFSSYNLFWIFKVIFYLFGIMTGFYKFYCIFKIFYYGFCIFIAGRGMIATRLIIISMISQQPSLNQNPQRVPNPAMEMELHPSANISGNTEIESDSPHYYYPATNNSRAVAGQINQGDKVSSN